MEKLQVRVYCLECGSNCCQHLQQSRITCLTRRERELLQQLLDSKGLSGKQIGANLGLAEGTVKVYTYHLFKKLQWHPSYRSSGRLRLWAFVHAEKLGLTVPTIEDFKDDFKDE